MVRQRPRCRVWWAHPRDTAAWHRTLFTDAERDRAAAYRHKVDADRFMVGCALTRLALGQWLGTAPAGVPLRRDCPDCGRPHGKTRVDGDPAFVSVSHSGDWVVVAVTDAGPIGVDVEAHRGIGDDLARTVLDDTEFREVKQAPPGRKEAAFFTYWVRKEAAVKATGDGLRTDLKKVRVSGYRQRPLVLEYPASPAMWLADLEAGADHSAAVAVIAPRIPAVTHHNGAELLSTPASPHALG